MSDMEVDGSRMRRSDYQLRDSTYRSRSISPKPTRDENTLDRRKQDEDADKHATTRTPPNRSELRYSAVDSDDDYRRLKKQSQSPRRDRPRKRSLSRSSDEKISARRSERRDRDRDRDRRKRRDGDSHGKYTEEKPYRTRSRRSLSRSRSPSPKYQRPKGPLPSQNDAFKTTNYDKPARRFRNRDEDSKAISKPLTSQIPTEEKQKPNYKPTGRLAAASNTIHVPSSTGRTGDKKAVVLKYNEPPEARKPSARDTWRMYIFKDKDIISTIELSEQSCWLIGREEAVVDLFVEHPSCSKQHAALQFRYVEKRNEFGDKIGKVKPYVIDLESANGTSINGEEVPAGRFVEVRNGDVLSFGHSTREYLVQLPPR